MKNNTAEKYRQAMLKAQGEKANKKTSANVKLSDIMDYLKLESGNSFNTFVYRSEYYKIK